MTINLERAAMLLHIIKGSAELGPNQANSIGALASAELRAMDDEARKELAARAEKAKREAAMQQAKPEPVEDKSDSEDGEPTPATGRRL